MNRAPEEQLRELVRQAIREELKRREIKKDPETNITTSDLRDKEGKKVGYMKHTELPTGGFAAGGRIGPNATEKEVDETSYEPKYNKDAVDKAIASSKQKIGSAEAKAIHRLLKGRHGNAPTKSVEDRAKVKEGTVVASPAPDPDEESKTGEKKRIRRPKDKRSIEQKARDIGQREMFPETPDESNESSVIHLDKLRQTPTYKQILLGSKIGATGGYKKTSR
jgi:hypothetical protein